MKQGARELSLEEIRDRFLDTVSHLIRHWQQLDGSTSERIEGSKALFSVLVLLDGSSSALPAFVVAPAPHPDNKQYCTNHGEDYFPAGMHCVNLPSKG